MLPYQYIESGSWVNPATSVAVNVPLSAKPDLFIVRDITNWGAQSTAAAQLESTWNSAMATGSYLGTGQPSSTTTGVVLYATRGTTGGFTFIDPVHPISYGTVTSTGIDKTTFVVTATNTSFAVGDYVRITNAVGMQEVSGMVFQITALTSTTSFTCGYMASAVSAGLTLAANATAATVRKVNPSQFYPRRANIAMITQATQAVVYFSHANTYTPGEIVGFSIPSLYGMTQLNNVQARVLSVTNSSTVSSITLDWDTSGYTAFTYPTSAQALAGAASPAVCVPSASGVVPSNGSATIPQSPPGTNLLDAFDNRTQYYMNVGTNVVGAASATMQWIAYKSDANNAITNA